MIRFATVPHPAPDPLEPPPGAGPRSDPETLEALEEEIATLAAHIHAATHRLLTLIAEFDRRRGWEVGGHASCAHWLSARTGIDLGASREKVRAARALKGLPETSASMARGELSFSQLRALTRVATADNEGDLLELARGCTTAQLERMIRGFRRGSREDEAEAERRRHQQRSLSVFPDEAGMYVVRGLLPAEVGALLMRAVEAASYALYREERAANAAVDSEKAGAQRRADALGLLAERALAAGLGDPPISGSRAERFQVVLHVEPEAVSGTDTSARSAQPPHGPLGSAGPRSELDDGTRVSAETSRRLACDAGMVRIHHAPDGSILDVGRRTRTIPPAVRRALEARDGGCRFPGCGLRFTDAHHITHWADRGETKVENLVLLCRFHHRLVHEEGWKVGWWGEGRAVFFDPRGGTHFDGGWEPPELGDRPGAALIDENRRRGVEPDGWTTGARWKREADIPDRIYFPAVEALQEAGS